MNDKYTNKSKQQIIINVKLYSSFTHKPLSKVKFFTTITRARDVVCIQSLFLNLSLKHIHVWTHTHTYSAFLTKAFKRDSLSLIVLLKFPFTFSCSSLKPSVLICTTFILKDFIINTLQNANGLKSTIWTHCIMTLIYSLSVSEINTYLTKSHRLAVIPACQAVNRDQLLFLFDYRGLCRFAALNYNLSAWDCDGWEGLHIY